LEEDEQAAWRSYLAMHDELMLRLERGLKSRSGLTLGDFAVLVELSETPEQALRPSDLARRLRWEQSRLSHRLRRMEQRDLVRRTECTEDGRGALIEHTTTGRRSIEDAAPGHARELRRLLVDVLGPTGMRTLGRLTGQVLDSFTGSDSA